MKESAVSEQIQKAAERLGIRLWRNQNGMYQVGNRWIRSGLCVGAADFIGYGFRAPYKGVFCAIEVKASGKLKNLSEEQAAFLNKCIYAGAIAGCADSVDELIKIVHAWPNLKPDYVGKRRKKPGKLDDIELF
jgi:hypothetical protein